MKQDWLHNFMRLPVIISLSIAGIIGVFGFVIAGRKTKLLLSEQRPESIDLTMGGERVGKITNADMIMAVLREGRSIRAHDCQMAGLLVLHYSGGEDTQIYISPGHSESDYEFVFRGSYFSVPRSSFISALASAGIDEKTIPTR